MPQTTTCRSAPQRAISTISKTKASRAGARAPTGGSVHAAGDLWLPLITREKLTYPNLELHKSDPTDRRIDKLGIYHLFDSLFRQIR